MDGATSLIKNIIWGIVDFVLVLDALIGIYSGNGTAFDYVLLVLSGCGLLLALAHRWIRKKHINAEKSLQTDSEDT